MFYFIFSFHFFFRKQPTRLQERLKKLANHAANIEFFFYFVCFVFCFLLITLIIIFNNLYVCMCFLLFFSVSSSHFTFLSWGFYTLHATTVLPIFLSAFPKMIPPTGSVCSLSSLPKNCHSTECTR